MRYWMGVFFLVSGTLSLFLNEFTVQVRRVWPWRRSDDTEIDRQLNRFYRVSVFISSIGLIEIGLLLSELRILHWMFRLVIYLVVGIWLVWRWRRLVRGVEQADVRKVAHKS